MKPLLINLDLKINNYAELELKQGCNDVVIATITDLGEVADLTGQNVSVEMLKADKTFIIQNNDITVLNNKITIKLNKDFTRVYGKAKMQIKLTKATEIMGSWVVDCWVRESAINTAVGESGNIVTIIETLKDNVDLAVLENDRTENLITTGGAATKGELAETNSQLAEKASKDDVANISSGTPLFASSVSGMTDTTKNYVNTTDGYLYNYSSGIWNKTTAQYQSTGISDKSVTSTKTDFLNQKNLVVFGNFISGKKIQGDAGSGMSLINDVNYNILAINVKANTTYTLVLPEDLGLEDGYYWLKVATSTKTKEDILNNFNNLYTFDGSFKYTKTDGYLKALWVNTGANDKCVFIQLGKYKKPTYLEFLEDKVNDRRYLSYIDSAFPLFNCYSKIEVESKLANIGNGDNKIFITKVESGAYVTIYYKYLKGYIGYRYGVYGDGAINLNTYRLIDIKTYDFGFNPQYIISNAPYDNEGVLKIRGEVDYIGGVHGDEKSPVLSVFIDGKVVNFTDIPVSGLYCNEIKFIVASDIYHCDNPSSLAFKKTKQTYFDKDGVHVNNKWVAQHTIELEHVRACLLSVNKVDSTTKLIDYYYDDKVITTPQYVPVVSGSYTTLATDKNINNVFMTGLIQCQVWGVRGGSDSELYSQITDFGNRIKPYFDCYTGRTVNVGDVLTCQNNFNIKYN